MKNRIFSVCLLLACVCFGQYDHRSVDFVGYVRELGVRSVYVDDGIAYVADSPSGLRVFDVSTPETPAEIGYLSTPGEAFAVTKKDDIIILSDLSGGVSLIDVSDPSCPEETGYFDTVGRAIKAQIKGDTLYVVDEDNGLVVLDISNPMLPLQIGYYNSPYFSFDVCILDSIAYLMCGEDGFQVLDISDIDSIFPVNELFCPYYDGANRDIEISGRYGFIAAGGAGILIYDLSSVGEPIEMSRFTMLEPASELQIVNGFAYIASYSGGLRVLNISNPEMVTESGYFVTGGRAQGVFVTPPYAFIADMDSGLFVLDVGRFTGVEETPTLPFEISLSVYPNPFNSSCEILAPDKSGIEIFDLQGHEIATGQVHGQSYSWNPSKDVASGIYLVKAVFGDQSMSKRVVYLK